MGTRPDGPRTIRFGPFAIDLQTHELRKNGIKLKLGGQAFEVLLALIERPLEVVSREELRQRLWPDHRAVDYDLALKKSISRLRDLLGDSAESPRFIETIPRCGYRFMVAIESSDRPNSAYVGRKANWILTLGLSFVVMGALAALFALRHIYLRVPKVTSFTRITNDGATKVPSGGCCPLALVNDGSTVFFTEKPKGAWVIGEVPAVGGEVGRLASPFPHGNNVAFDMSPNRSELLISPWEGWELETPLWVLSVPGGSARPLGQLEVNDACWSSDGKSIIYGKGHELYMANGDGSESRKLATMDGIVYLPRQSPDGKVIRFTVYDARTDKHSLWEISLDGTGSHLLIPSGPILNDDCCGAWMSDGKYYVFQSMRDGRKNIWVMSERDSLFGSGKSEPIQLTSGPMDFLAPSPSPSGKKLFVIGQQSRGELLRYDYTSRQFVSFLSGISAEGLDFSKKGDWLAYVTYPESTLWRTREDGTDRLQLTDPSIRVGSPSISPDGKWIAFMGSKPNAAWKIYLISARGSSPEQLIVGAGSEWNPSWSPSGGSLIFGESMWSPTASIHLIDLETRRVSTLPGSQGLFYPRWSPDGRFIIATSIDSLKLLIFDVNTQTWRDLAHGRWISSPAWSQDSRFVFFFDLQEEDLPFYQVRIADGKSKRVATVKQPGGLAGGPLGRWTGLAPDDSPLILRNIGSQEIFALDLQLP